MSAELFSIGVKVLRSKPQCIRAIEGGLRKLAALKPDDLHGTCRASRWGKMAMMRPFVGSVLT